MAWRTPHDGGWSELHAAAPSELVAHCARQHPPRSLNGMPTRCAEVGSWSIPCLCSSSISCSTRSATDRTHLGYSLHTKCPFTVTQNLQLESALRNLHNVTLSSVVLLVRGKPCGRCSSLQPTCSCQLLPLVAGGLTARFGLAPF